MSLSRDRFPLGLAPASLTNFILGWKGLPWTLYFNWPIKIRYGEKKFVNVILGIYFAMKGAYHGGDYLKVAPFG
jgi:hypothetical protein